MKTITVDEMAKELGVGRQKIYAMLHEGQIPHLRSGALYIVSRVAWERWVEQIGEVA